MAALNEQSFQYDIADELTLRGNVVVEAGQERKPVVILVHGFKGFKDWGFFPYAAEELAKQGFAVIRFNFTCNGVGETDFDELHKFGANTYSREQADLSFLLGKLNAHELPLTEHMDLSRIALIGHSRGGGNSLIFAAEHEAIRAVVTWNGVANVNLFPPAFEEEVRTNGIGYVANARTKQQMPILPVFFDDLKANAARFDLLKAIAGLSIPVLTIQGDRDAEYLVRGHEQLSAASPQHKHAVIEGANHTLGAVHPFAGTTGQLQAALSLTADFLQQSL